MPEQSDATSAELGGPALEAGELHLSFYARAVKRPVDLVLSWLALIACLPALLIIFALVCLESEGGMIFKQRRIGMGGREFNIYKVRTMCHGAHEHSFKTEEGDWRITRLGKFLRDTKLDELPQLWNVIRGDMSLIGPRPLSVEECDHLRETHGFYPGHPGFYPLVKPGLTGLEQIYRIHPLVYSERFRWNSHYEENLTAALDLRIFFTTMMQCRLVCIATAIGGIAQLAILAKLALVP